MLVVYSPTCPSSRSAASTYWTRAGLSVYPGIAMRGCGGPGGENFPLSAACMTALEHILHGPDRKLYNFALGPEDLKLLDRAAEGFAAAQLERSFRTLGYYKAIHI